MSPRALKACHRRRDGLAGRPNLFQPFEIMLGGYRENVPCIGAWRGREAGAPFETSTQNKPLKTFPLRLSRQHVGWDGPVTPGVSALQDLAVGRGAPGERRSTSLRWPLLAVHAAGVLYRVKQARAFA